MEKRYRRPIVKNGEMRLQKGKVDGNIDMCIFFADDIPPCDRALLFYFICTENHNYSGGKCKSLTQELEDRGYDLETLRFSISKKSSK